MNALLRKEVRLLLPSFAAALSLSFSLWFLPSELDGPSRFKAFLTLLSFVACPALVVMMALDSFGKEISAGTFPLLLAQPVSRTHLWRIKTGLLGAATLIVLLSWVLALHFHVFDYLVRNMAQNDPGAWKWTLHAAAVLFALVTFSGGLWTVLFFRQVTAAFWLTLIVPGAIVIGFANLIERHPDTWRNAMMAALVLYSMAGFIWARRLFLRAQDVQPTGGAIAMPAWLKFRRQVTGAVEVVGQAPLLIARPAGLEARRSWRPRAALWWKELQLHQSQFVLAGVLLLLHLAVIGVRRFVNANEMPSLDFILHTFWVLWLFMALLVGCTAVAEERKLGTLEGQLCLPVARRRQFVSKFLCALLLTVFFGALMPVLLEGKRILPAFDPFDWESSFDHPDGYYPQFGPYLGELLSLTIPLLGLAGLAGIAALIGLMAFYASTLSRNALQSFAPAVLGLFLVSLIWKVAANTEELFGEAVWRGPLIYLLGVPAFVVALGGLMYWNFKRVLVGGMVWRRNLLVLLGTLLAVTTTTAALYHRAWEKFMRLEPPHGPAMLRADERVNLQIEAWKPLVKLSDGRIWASHGGRWNEKMGMIMSAGEFKGEFLEGTNWAKVVGTYRDLVGLRRDGSLWVKEQSQIIPAPPHSAPASKRLIRLGTDNDWIDAVPYQFQMALLLKADGTLWQLGTNRWSTNQPPPGLRAFTPQRLGTNTDWTEFSTQGGRILFHQRDGRFWTSPKYSSVDTNTLVLNAAVTLFRAPDFNLTDPSLVQAAWRGGSARVAVLPDGTFRAVGGWRSAPDRNGKVKWGMQKADVRIGSETNWLLLAGRDHGLAVTLKSDGTLWRWEFPEDPALRPDTAVATQISMHSDWVAVTAGWAGIFSLARDGSLWLWQFESLHLDQDRYALLRPSRRPQRMGNIF